MLTIALPNIECNLKCPHCNIIKLSYKFNEDKFFNIYKTITSPIKLFGGEPLLYKDRFKKCLELNSNIKVINSNMLLYSNEIQNIIYLNNKNVIISSSWDPFRFNNKTYRLWTYNLFCCENVKNVNITLTDYLYNYDFNKFTKVLSDLNDISHIDHISFSTLMPDYNRFKGDEFLCKVYKHLKENNYRLKIDIKNFFGKKFCQEYKTLYPNGDLVKGCPQTNTPTYYGFKECFTCKYYKICKPCCKLQSCWFPEKFYKLCIDNNEL